MSEHLDRRVKSLSYHRPSEPVQARMTFLRINAQAFVALLDAEIPECREKSLAVTAFEEAMMWAMKGLALTDPGGVVESP